MAFVYFISAKPNQPSSGTTLYRALRLVPPFVAELPAARRAAEQSPIPKEN